MDPLPAGVSASRARSLPAVPNAVLLARLQAAFTAGELRLFGTLAALAAPGTFAGRLDALRRPNGWSTPSARSPDPGRFSAYLGRYTHRVALANSRLTRLADGQVDFTWKDYRQHDKTKVMTLPADEFIRRFLLHAVPDGFHRIRHVGFLANRHRTEKLALMPRLARSPDPRAGHTPESYRDRTRRLTGQALDICPDCGGAMLERGPLPRSPPPRAAPFFWCDSS